MSLISIAINWKEVITKVVEAEKPGDCDLAWEHLEHSSPSDIEYSAEDGGSALRELRTYKVIAVKAWAARFSRGVPQQASEGGFVGLVLPQDFRAAGRIRIYRQILEADVASRAAPSGGIALFDGSPPVRWGRVGLRRWQEALEFVGSVIRPNWDVVSGLSDATCESEEPECVAEVIEKSRVRPFSAYLLLSLASKGALNDAMELARRRGLRHSWLDALENLERLIVLRDTLETIWGRGSTPVFVIKTSRTTSLCRSSMPDIHLIERKLRELHDLEAGFTARLYTSVAEYFGLDRESAKRLYPDVKGVRDFYQGRVAVLSTFARLRRAGYVFKVEALLARDQVEGANEAALARSVLSRVASLPLTAEGYPMALVIADRNARVSEAEMDGIMKALGADLLPESRSVLRV
ncbi:MAG: DNA double-strand break repair nuclease NurA [Acidilobus sp.]